MQYCCNIMAGCALRQAAVRKNDLTFILQRFFHLPSPSPQHIITTTYHKVGVDLGFFNCSSECVFVLRSLKMFSDAFLMGEFHFNCDFRFQLISLVRLNSFCCNYLHLGNKSMRHYCCPIRRPSLNRHRRKHNSQFQLSLLLLLLLLSFTNIYCNC